jgi:hypothetical protein
MNFPAARGLPGALAVKLFPSWFTLDLRICDQDVTVQLVEKGQTKNL